MALSDVYPDLCNLSGGFAFAVLSTFLIGGEFFESEALKNRALSQLTRKQLEVLRSGLEREIALLQKQPEEMAAD
jgi:hypothetical protein